MLIAGDSYCLQVPGYWLVNCTISINLLSPVQASGNQYRTICNNLLTYQSLYMQAIDTNNMKELVQSKWNKRPLIISGPCSAETEEQVMETAQRLAAYRQGRSAACRYLETPYKTR